MAPAPTPHPTVDEVDFDALHEETRHEIETDDGWTLVITRLRPREQAFPQPVFGAPLLMIHGFAQNRRAWTSGELAKNLLYFGADLFLLELRGHGRSSPGLQRRRSAESGRPLPTDLDYDWDIDSYFLHDIPAAVAAVKRLSGRERIFWVGHSMGGMLGYGYAGLQTGDLAGLVAIGAPSDLGDGFLMLRALSRVEHFMPAVDGTLAGLNLLRRSTWQLQRRLGVLPSPRPDALAFRTVPVDGLLKILARAFTDPRYVRLTQKLPGLAPLVNPNRVRVEAVRQLLKESSHQEPRKVALQFLRWIRRGELKCYRTGYDFKANFDRIDLPMAIIFGERDWLADMRATRSIYHRAKSEYLLWRPVKGNSHVELTMGHDIRQIAYDIKNLVEYAWAHEDRTPSLPRRR